MKLAYISAPTLAINYGTVIMQSFLRYLVLASIFYAPYSAAVVIDFEEIDNSLTNVFSDPSLDSQGFNFTISNAGPAALLHWAANSPYNADPGGVTYTHNFRGMITTLTTIGGGAFDLTSIDFGDVLNDPNPMRINVMGYYQGGGSITSVIMLDSLIGLETFNFNWSNLSSVTWTKPNGWLQLDNVVVNESEFGRVPEPATLALTSLGLLGMGYRRKQQKAA